MIRTFAFAAALVQLANAFLKEEKFIRIEQPETLFVTDRYKHTVDEETGLFKHPFLHADENVNTISYENGKSFSASLHRVKGPMKNFQSMS